MPSLVNGSAPEAIQRTPRDANRAHRSVPIMLQMENSPSPQVLTQEWMSHAAIAYAEMSKRIGIMPGECNAGADSLRPLSLGLTNQQLANPPRAGSLSGRTNREGESD